jgi:hypothetical protein
MQNDDQAVNTSQFGLKIALWLLFTAVIVSVTLLAWVPPVSRDALTHHLAVPKLYLQQGGIHEIPAVKFSYYPMNLDLLYMIPLYFDNDIIPKFIHFAFALLTAWLIFSYLRPRLDSIWAGGGALFFLSLPIITKLSITVYVDLGLVFFSTAALMDLIKWIENRFKIKYLILSAIWCGLALGTKYNALIVLFLLTVFIPLLYILRTKPETNRDEKAVTHSPKKRQLRAAGSGALFCLIALVVFSPWMIRNYIWKNNPVYPLYNRFFNAHKDAEPTRGAGVRQAAGNLVPAGNKKDSRAWGPFAIRKVIYGEGGWEIALIPLRIFLQGRDDDPRYFDGKLNPFLLLLPFFAFWQLKNDSKALRIEKQFLLAYSILFILYAFLKTDMRIRYITPTVPPLVILATFGLYQIHKLIAPRLVRGSQQGAQALVLALAAGIFIFNAAYIVQQFKKVDPFSYISGRIERDSYITRYRPEYAVIQYANSHLSADAKLLVLFMGNRRYYSDKDMLFGNQLFLKTVKKVDSAKALLTDLQKRGLTHLLIRYDLFNRWSGEQFSDREKKILTAFFEGNVKALVSQNGYGLFELADSH